MKNDVVACYNMYLRSIGISDVRLDGMNEDASARLAYGLAKKYNINTEGMSPKEVWDAIKEKTGVAKEQTYGKQHINDVDGPGQTREFINGYIKTHKEIGKTASRYMGVRKEVGNFAENYKNKHGKPPVDGTYNAVTGEPVEFDSGFSVTFHQNKTKTDTLGGYSDKDYAYMCAIAKTELGSEDAYIGYFGNPEVSFHCESREQAMKFAIAHNQHSIYDCECGEVIINPHYNKKTNPIEM